jgi:hypothetical protein
MLQRSPKVEVMPGIEHLNQKPFEGSPPGHFGALYWSVGGAEPFDITVAETTRAFPTTEAAAAAARAAIADGRLENWSLKIDFYKNGV